MIHSAICRFIRMSQCLSCLYGEQWKEPTTEGDLTLAPCISSLVVWGLWGKETPHIRCPFKQHLSRCLSIAVFDTKFSRSTTRVYVQVAFITMQPLQTTVVWDWWLQGQVAAKMGNKWHVRCATDIFVIKYVYYFGTSFSFLYRAAGRNPGDAEGGSLIWSSPRAWNSLLQTNIWYWSMNEQQLQSEKLQKPSMNGNVEETTWNGEKKGSLK